MNFIDWNRQKDVWRPLSRLYRIAESSVSPRNQAQSLRRFQSPPLVSHVNIHAREYSIQTALVRMKYQCCVFVWRYSFNPQHFSILLQASWQGVLNLQQMDKIKSQIFVWLYFFNPGSNNYGCLEKERVLCEGREETWRGWYGEMDSNRSNV